MGAIKVVILTGLSGAGRSVALQVFEDLGYFCIDNLPPALMPKLGELVVQSNGNVHKFALVCDARGRALGLDIFDALKELEASAGTTADIIYLEADDASLVRRYKETRRKHPLSPEGRVPEGIEFERKKLEEIRGRADWIIDTSELKPTELKQMILDRFASDEERSLQVNVVSFGFKHGALIDADLLFDVRCLPNPHYVESLRPLTGFHPEVYEYVMKWPVTQQFTEKMMDMIDFLLPLYFKEGKSQLVIGIGCTGGQHRSVAIAELLYQHLKDREKVQITHRDTKRDV
ncbi:MAG: RNase adaptor protein RapZ [Bacilli bacterium]|nr:RNase adaptor protein RapZ [Bacilli bacterium]